VRFAVFARWLRSGEDATKSERLRQPRPLLRHRMPSGRGAVEQPNAGSDTPEVLTPVFWAMVVLTGVATGLFGAFLMYLLHSVQHLTYDYGRGEFQAAVERASWIRRLVALAIAGTFAGPAWYLLRRLTPGARSDVHGTVWEGEGELSVRRSLPSAIFSEIVVGMGASLGREQAPQLLGAVSGSLLGRCVSLPPGQRRLLVACGSGAGLAAVYNVPLGGALIIAELLFGEISLTVVLPALVTSVIATMVAWIYLPNQPTYLHLVTFHLTDMQIVWSIVVGPVIGLVAVGWTRLIGWTSAHHVSGRRLLVAPLVAFIALALLGFHYPQLLGNGKDLAHMAFLGQGSIALFFALFALKPLVTAACLGSGATGGLFTPTFSTGAMLGAFLGAAWSLAWPGVPVAVYAVLGAGAMLGAALQAPLAALVITLEMTHTTLNLVVPLVIATGLATVTARYVDGYSIYSSRLPRRTSGKGSEQSE
jgi:CIC family chloride channel protein